MSAGRRARIATISSVLVVAAVAAIVSYAHMYELAVRSGESWRAWLIPLSVDGMLVAATAAIVDRRRVREPAGWVPWLGLTLGIGASLAANIAAARPELVAQIVAGWPPVALAVSIETLVVVLRGTSPQQATSSRRPPAAAPAVTAPRAEARPARPKPAAPDDRELARARELVDAARAVGRRYGRVGLAQDLGISQYRARDLMKQLDDEVDAPAQMRLVMG